MVLMLPRQMPTVPVMAPLRAMPWLVRESVFDFLAKMTAVIPMPTGRIGKRKNKRETMPKIRAVVSR